MLVFGLCTAVLVALRGGVVAEKMTMHTGIIEATMSRINADTVPLSVCYTPSRGYSV